MVPMTVAAFYLSSIAVPDQVTLLADGQQRIFDLVAISICALGVFVFNWFEEKKQDTNVEMVTI